jgi:acetolactate synthase-1/3 small subunit
MNDTFLFEIDRAEGSLQRLIGVIERRGFHIEGMNVADLGSKREVRIAVRARDAHRCIDVLGRQIDRLIGVRRLDTDRRSEADGAVVCAV